MLVEFWKIESKNIESYVLSKVRSSVAASDLMQDIYIKASHNLAKLKDKSKLKPWLYSIVNNSIKDYFRKQKTDTVSVENIQLEADEPTQKHTHKDCLVPLINRLPKKYSKPLYLSDIKGLKQSVVAERLELKLPTVKSRIQRGRELLKDQYMYCCNFKKDSKGKLVGKEQPKENCKVCKH